MNWMHALYATYEQNRDYVGRIDKEPAQGNRKERLITPLLPLYHSMQNAHITITLNRQGELVNASLNNPNTQPTIIPVTEGSGGRTSGACPHPLCDKLQYVAGDNADYFPPAEPPTKRTKQVKTLLESYEQYEQQLSEWAAFDPGNIKLNAILAYIRKKSLIADLVKEGILHVENSTNTLVPAWKGDKQEMPSIFEILGASTQENAFIRWKVNSRDGSPAEVYHDPSMYESWRRYTESKSTKRGMCYILGQTAPLAANHPARIRNAGDKAKLISSNDSSGYTYRGKFIEADEACGVSTEVTQKAHSALRWLISRQGWYDGDLVILAWSPGLLNVPSPCGNVQEWQHYAPDQPTPNDQVTQLVKQFKKELSGGGKERLQTSLNENDIDNRVLVLSLNSASPGRMSLSSFQEFSVSDYLNNLLAWHSRASWKQHLPKDKEGNNRSYIGAPSISMIVKAAYGSKVDDKLRKHALSRLLPCVLQNLPIPPDLEKQCILQASKRHSMEWWEWEMTLGVSCSIYRYNHPQTNTSSSDIMSLDSSITDRSYLFGRLLAVAEAIEASALKVTNTSRPTNAEKFMQRFQQRPAETWPMLEKSIQPYRNILHRNEKTIPYLKKYDEYLDNIMDTFLLGQLMDNAPLTGAYLLGYHCQRAFIYKPKEEKNVQPTE